MDNNNIDIKAKTKIVSNNKTKAQQNELNSLKKQKADIDSKAKQAQKDKQKEIEAKRKEQELQAKKKEERNDINLQDLASGIIKTVSKSKKKSNFFTGLIIGLVVGFIASNLFGFSSLTDQVNEGKDTVDEIITENFIGYTSADFEEAILGAKIEHQELIVMEQPLEIETTLTKSGIGNLQIFSKIKTVTYKGSGIYTVDLSKIDKKHIEVDLDNKIVRVSIPHTILQMVNLDINSMEFDDTEKGLLAFGDLSLTMEQQNELEQTVKSSMEKRLNDTSLFEQADELAKYKTWQIFQPLISAVSNEFVVEMIIN